MVVSFQQCKQVLINLQTKLNHQTPEKRFYQNVTVEGKLFHEISTSKVPTVLRNSSMRRKVYHYNEIKKTQKGDYIE